MPSLGALTDLVLWEIPQVLAQQASNCGAQPSPQNLNASLEYLIRSPFTTPSGLFQGGSGDWIWNIGTVSYALSNNGKSGSVAQSIWLETESFIDLTSPAIGHIGCGAIFHGLTYAATVNGQADAGDCGPTLGAACARAMLSDAACAARHASSLTCEPSDAAAVCANLAIAIPAVCDAFFTENAYIQTFVFASPEDTSICSDTPAASNFTNPLASWSPQRASYSLKSMTSYYNLTTAVSPIITAMFTNQTSSNDASDIFARAILSCLRPANISQNSISPARVPKDGAANLNGAVVSPSVSSTSAAVSVVATGGADGLRLTTEWLCTYGLGALFWRLFMI